MLQQNAKERSESSANAAATATSSYSLPQTSTKMSMQELDELRKKLGNMTASSNAPQVSPSDSAAADPKLGLTPEGQDCRETLCERLNCIPCFSVVWPAAG